MVSAEKAPLNVPDHVDPALVWDNSYAGFLSELADPFEAVGRLHEGPDVIWATNAAFGKPAWIPTRHELIKEAFADYEHFSNRRGTLVGSVMESDWLLLPVESDPPEHHEYRNILLHFFSPALVQQRRSQVQQLCDSLIDGFAPRGSCEFISEFSSILPNAIVVALMGMPQEMLPQFLHWEEKVIRGRDDEERLAAGHAIIDYLQTFIAEQKENPQSELMGIIISARVQGRPLNDAEILGICYLLFVAGLDTVYNTLGWIMRYLALDQGLQHRLREQPADISLAVEEFTRAYGVSAPSRTVAKDFVFHGVTMREGDDVILPTALAGRDPRAWPDPHRIDIDRKPRHVTFGNGPHLCLGVHLARMEMQIVIESFLSRFDNIRIPAGEELTFHTASIIGLDYLPLTWDG